MPDSSSFASLNAKSTRPASRRRDSNRISLSRPNDGRERCALSDEKHPDNLLMPDTSNCSMIVAIRDSGGVYFWLCTLSQCAGEGDIRADGWNERHSRWKKVDLRLKIALYQGQSSKVNLRFDSTKWGLRGDSWNERY